MAFPAAPEQGFLREDVGGDAARLSHSTSCTAPSNRVMLGR